MKTVSLIKAVILRYSCSVTGSRAVKVPVHPGFLPVSVVKCLTSNPRVPCSSRTGSCGFFVGVYLGKILQSPSLVLVKPRKDMNNVSCCSDMTEILLKMA